MAPTQITVQGYYEDAPGVPSVGAVEFRLTHPLYDTAGHVVATQAPITADLVAGALSVVLYATTDDATTPDNALWEITEQIAGARERRWEFGLDADSTSPVDITTLTPASSGPTSYSYVTRAEWLAGLPSFAGITAGVLVDQPAAGHSGRMYLATDVDGGTLYRDNGSSWDQVAAGTDPTLTGDVGGTAGANVIGAGKITETKKATDAVSLVSVVAYGATGDGSTDDHSAFVSADAVTTTKYVPPGTYRFSTSVALTGRYVFAAGAILKPDSARSVTISGTVEAPVSQIFDGTLGTVTFSGKGQAVRPEWWGALGDWRQVTDATVATGSDTTLLTSATAVFTTADVGKNISVSGTNGSGYTLTTTVASYVSATQVRTTAVMAGGTLSGLTVQVWTDDQAAFKKMVASLASAKKPLVDLQGVRYVLGRDSNTAWSLNINVSNLTIRGAGASTVLAHPAGMPNASVSILRPNNVSNLTIEDLSLNGNWFNSVNGVDDNIGINHTTQVDPKNHAIAIRGCTNVHLSRVAITQTYGDGVWIGQRGDVNSTDSIYRSINVRLSNVDVDMSARNAVTAGQTCETVRMINCRFTNIYSQAVDTEPQSTAGGDGIFHEMWCRDVDVSGCYVGGWWNPGNVARSTNSPLSIVGGKNVAPNAENAARTYRVRNCTILGSIIIEDALDVIIENNRIILDWDGYGYSPIYVRFTVDDIVIKNNYIYDRVGSAGGTNHEAAISVANYTTSGVDLQPAGVRIEGNRVYARNGRYGIKADGVGGGGAVEIVGNYVDCVGGGTSPGGTVDTAGAHGIHLYASKANARLRVNRNTIRGATSAGINVRSSDLTRAFKHLEITDNHVFDDQTVPTCTAAVNFQGTNYWTYLLMRNNVAGTGVAAVTTGLSSGTWQAEGGSAPRHVGYGAPEGVVTAPIGATYHRLDGSTDTTVYRKESGTSNTGWVATTTVTTILTVNAQTGTTYTLVLGDANNMITLNNAAAIVLTIPTNATVAIPVGATIVLQQLGAGQVQVVPAGGVTLQSTPGAYLRAQNSLAAITKTGTNTWVMSGDISS